MCILLLRQEVHCSPLRKETGDSSQVCTSHSKRPFIKQYSLRASLVAQMVKNLCAMQETQVQPLSWEDPLEKGMATHSSVLAWRIP